MGPEAGPFPGSMEGDAARKEQHKPQSTREGFTQVRAAMMRKTLLLL